jgi:protein CMS1
MPPDMQADRLRSIMKSCKRCEKMTDLELDEIGIKESMLVDCTSVKVGREEQVVGDFIKEAMPSLSGKITSLSTANTVKKGQPVLLVITGNAQRAADLAKVLRNLSPTAKGEKDEKKKKILPVGKLFARHFKVAEQEAFLKSTACLIAVGTPQRVYDLLVGGALQLDSLQALVLDITWADVKMKTLLDNAETRESLCSLLASDAIQARIKSKSKQERASIVLF